MHTNISPNRGQRGNEIMSKILQLIGKLLCALRRQHIYKRRGDFRVCARCGKSVPVKRRVKK